MVTVNSTLLTLKPEGVGRGPRRWPWSSALEAVLCVGGGSRRWRRWHARSAGVRCCVRRAPRHTAPRTSAHGRAQLLHRVHVDRGQLAASDGVAGEQRHKQAAIPAVVLDQHLQVVMQCRPPAPAGAICELAARRDAGPTTLRRAGRPRRMPSFRRLSVVCHGAPLGRARRSTRTRRCGGVGGKGASATDDGCVGHLGVCASTAARASSLPLSVACTQERTFWRNWYGHLP